MNSSAYTSRAILGRIVMLCFALALFGCSDDETTSGSTCPQGEEQNPITGECELSGRVDPDNNPIPDASDGGTNDEDTTGGGDDGGGGGDDDTGGQCQENERRCQGGNAEICANGEFTLYQECEGDETCDRGNCVPDGGGLCTPGESRCLSATHYEVCSSDGESYGEATSCPSGQRCEGGECKAGCAGMLNEKSNLGCEYISMRHNQASGLQTLPHTVVVSNPGDDAAQVRVTSPGIASFNMPDVTIQPGDSEIINFPTSPMIEDPGPTNELYILNTSHPVIATQFSPLNNPGIGSETSDASLLLPTNAIGTNYVVLGWRGPPGVNFPGLPGMNAGTYVDIVAIEDNTQVQVTSPRALDGGSAGSVAAGGTATFNIPRNHVLHLSENGGTGASETDVSGTIISSNEPVAVYTGATIVNIPDAAVRPNSPSGCSSVGDGCVANADCCTGICGHEYQNGQEVAWTCMDHLTAGDHVENQMLPTDTWGTHYVTAPFFNRGVNDFVVYKITSATDGNNVTIDPPPVYTPASFTLSRGEVRQFISPEAFELQADEPVMLAQFMIGGTNSPSGDGDPAFMLPPAVEQFRDNYVFLVPDQYHLNFVTLIAPDGVDVELDGTTHPASDFTPVGSGSGWGYKLVEGFSFGVHHASASQPFGVVVHGMDEYISYAFPGGITLPE